MATRVNYNVFRYGKTIKWNFSAPCNSYNRLIRASYVFNKWCPIILKHFNITALRFVFKIESLDAHIIFLGYRRLSTQKAFAGYFAGSAFHSKFSEDEEGNRFPQLPIIYDFPAEWTTSYFQPVPFSRFLVPINNPYHLVKKAMGINNLHNFSPLITRSFVDNSAQFAFFKFFETLCAFDSQFFNEDLKVINSQKAWRITRRMKASLNKLLVRGELAQAGTSSYELLEKIINDDLPLYKRKAQFFGRSLKPSDFLLYLFSSAVSVFPKVARLKQKVVSCQAAIRQIRRVRAGYKRLMQALAVERFIPSERYLQRQGIRRYRRLLRKSLKILRLKKKLRKIYLKEFAKKKIFYKSFKKKSKLLKNIVASYSKYFMLCGYRSTVPSATNYLNAFLFDEFFKKILDKKVDLGSEQAKTVMPDLLNHLKHKIWFQVLLKRYIRLALTRGFKRKLLSSRLKRLKNRNIFSLPTLKLSLYFLSAVREASLLEKKNVARLSVYRKKGHPFFYNFDLSRPSSDIKRVLHVVRSFYKSLKKKPRSFWGKKKLSYYKSSPSRPLGALLGLLRSINKALLVSPLYSVLFSQLGPRFFTIIRSDKQVFNLFSDIVPMINKFKGSRRISVGPLADTAFVLRSFPVDNRFAPFVFDSKYKKADLPANWSFFQVKDMAREYFYRFSMEVEMLRIPCVRLRFFRDIRDCVVAPKAGALPVSRTIRLFSESLGKINPDVSQRCADIIQRRVADGFPAEPYIDDVKEALSLDFVPSFDASKKEFDSNEYRSSLVFSKPVAFLSELPFFDDELDPLNIKQLRYISSVILANFSDLKYSLSDSRYIYSTSEHSNNSFFLPSSLEQSLTKYINFLKILFFTFRKLAKIYTDDKWSLEIDSDSGWLVFNKLIKWIAPIFNYYNSLRRLSWDPYSYTGSISFPILNEKLINYNHIFGEQYLHKSSRKYRVMSYILNPHYRRFFNYFSAQSSVVSINWYFHPASHLTRLEARDFDLYSFALLLQKNSSRQIHLATSYPESYDIFDGPFTDILEPYVIESKDVSRAFSKLSSVARLFNVSTRDDSYFHRFRSYCRMKKKKIGKKKRWMRHDFFKIQKLEDIMLSSPDLVLNFIGDRALRSYNVYNNFFDFFLDWILKVAAGRVIYTENSVILPNKKYKKYIISPFGLAPNGRLFTRYFFKNSISVKDKKYITNDLFAYFSLLLMYDLRKFYVKFVNKLVFRTRRNPTRRIDTRKVSWLTTTSSPYSEHYKTSHMKLLDDLSLTFYRIFSIPIFVKYFPLPIFYSSSPELSKFASTALAEVTKRGIKMNADIKDWYLEYLFVCYASLVTKSAEGIVNFAIRILPYYKKWGDPVSLLLSPIAAADLSSMGIETVKVSFRGRPSGVERARAINYVFGSVKNPAMRKLYTAGSYCYKQCISRKNGGVTSVHVWILGRV